MKNKRKIITTFIIILIILITVGGVYAYLTSTDSKTNIFTLGKVKIELTESNFVEANAQDVRPGDQITKDPKITNIGKNSAYVYIKVVNPIVYLSNGEGPLFSYTVNSGWIQLDEVEQCGYKATTYYYNTALNPNASTTKLFNTVTINNYSNDSNPDQNLIINGYAIQSNYLGNGSTITSIFNSTFPTDTSDTTGSCNSATDCNNNPVYTTVPTGLKGLAKIMAQNAYPDNAKSQYVNYCSGLNFNSYSSNYNGKGIYEIASTKYDAYPIYYYRGEVDNNNVKFAGFCWKAIRTTDTGGVKLIYNGLPDGSGYCTNSTGTSTQIGSSAFNSNNDSPSFVGYMYGAVYNTTYKPLSDLNNPIVFGNDVTYSGGTYTLIDTMTTTGVWSDDYNTLNNNHYTCFSTGTTCSSVYYMYKSTSSSADYTTLTNGKKIDDALDEMFNEGNINATNSTAKTKIDNWYNNNLSSYTSYIEDTIYCNDRSINSLAGWVPDGGNITSNLLFGPYSRSRTDHTPTLECNRALDRFTVSSTIGNGALTYPVGLITTDEIMYAGGIRTLSSGNRTYYLYNSRTYWTISSSDFPSDGAVLDSVGSTGAISQIGAGNSMGLRPVISLKSTDVVESGDGTSTNPYVIRTS